MSPDQLTSSSNPDSPSTQDRQPSPSARLEKEQASIVYSPESSLRRPGHLVAGLWRDIWNSRELTWRLLSRNIRSQYRQSLLGIGWAFLPAIANTAIWVGLTASKTLTIETPVDYISYVLTGMILWQAFIESFQAPSAAVTAGRSLLSKTPFPRESLLFVRFGEVLFNSSVRLSLLVIVFLFRPVELTWGVAFAPFGLLALMMFGMALGLLLMPLGALYQDVNRFMTTFAPFWMLLTPVVYALPDGGWGKLIMWLNPVSALLVSTRDIILTGGSEYFVGGLVTIGIAIPTLFLGLLLYRLSMPILIERIAS